jgi:hypothetical protein
MGDEAAVTARNWDHLSQRQRIGIIVAGGIQFALLGAALLDLWRRPTAQVRGRKRRWAAASFINFFGPLAYFAFGRRREDSSS